MVSTSLFGEPTVVGSQVEVTCGPGGFRLGTWMFPPTSPRWAGRRGMCILRCFLRLGPCGFPPDSLTLGGLLWGVYPSLIVNAAADTTGLEVGDH